MVLLFAMMLGQPEARPEAAARVIDVIALGADPDGVRDSTAAIQAALDEPAAAKIVSIPPGRYRVTGLVLRDAHDVRVEGDGATMMLTGAARPGDRMGLRLDGSVRDVTITGLAFEGDGTIEHRHTGVWSSMRARMNDVVLSRLSISDVTLGIGLAGRLQNIRIERCEITRTVGTEPGYGYGISVSATSDGPANVDIVNNVVFGATRHSIYQAQGRGVRIVGNTVLEHRLGVADGNMRPAILIARSSDVEVRDNVIYRYADGGVGVGAAPGLPATNVSVVGNVVLEPANAVAPIIIGNYTPDAEGSPGVVVVARNRIEGSRRSGEVLIRVLNGAAIDVHDNRLRMPVGCPTVTIEAHGERTVFTSRYTRRVRVTGNRIAGAGPGFMACVRLPDAARTGAIVVEQGDAVSPRASP